MQTLPVLKPQDEVTIIAPASRCSDQQLLNLQSLLNAWNLICKVQPDMFGEDILFANNDLRRFELLHQALQDPSIKAIISVRGGYGCSRLMPYLQKIKPIQQPKILLGMSDITTLHLYFNQKWSWPSLHGSLSQDIFSSESISLTKSILFGHINQLQWEVVPLNRSALENKKLISPIIGGNLSIVQTSIGTAWQLQGKDKIIFLEDTNERGYRIDRMLQHLLHSNIAEGANAIIFGDFIKGEESNGTSLVPVILENFANQCQMPVVNIAGVGHGPINFPLVFGTKAELTLGQKPSLICYR